MFKCDKKVLKMLRGSMIVMKCVRKNDLYGLEGVVMFESVSTVE